MLAYTDLYVVEQLILWGHAKKLDLSLFTTLVDEYKEIGPDVMKTRLQAKTDVNVLLRYLNWAEISKKEDADPVGFCNDLYDSLLFQEFDKNDRNSPHLKFTPLADSIQLIAADSSTEGIYVYTKYPCNHIEREIHEFMRSDKVHIITGDKKTFLSDHTFDSYFFEDVDDIEYISRRHSQRSEVIIPTFPFNVSGYKFTNDGEVVYSQDSLYKGPILNEPLDKYLSEYNLDIALIDIPI